MIEEAIGIDSTSAATRKAEANTLLNPRSTEQTMRRSNVSMRSRSEPSGTR